MPVFSHATAVAFYSTALLILLLGLVHTVPCCCWSCTGRERFNIALNGGRLVPGSIVRVSTDCGKSFEAKCRIDTDVEVEYFRNGGALHYVLRNMLNKS